MLEAMLTKAFLAKAATVVAGLSLATTGVGAADVLPQVAQDRVAAAVEKVSPLDLPDSQDPAGAPAAPDEADKAPHAVKADDSTEKPADGEKADKTEKPEQARDNFGQIVSARARSTEDKGKEFGQSVSADARARADARRADPTLTDDDDDQDEADRDGSSTAKGHRPSDTPTAQANRGSGRRP